MNRQVGFVALAILLGSFGAHADAAAVTLGNTVQRQIVNGTGGVASRTFTASTVHQDEYPAEAGQPLFWFDCSETNGWQFTEEGGVIYVIGIPSKVGSRSLIPTANGGHWNTFTLQKPVFAEGSAKVQGRRILDFGSMGSKRGLVFDPVSYNGGSLSNLLDNIGTVITVFDASQGGGFLLGGGYGMIGTWYNSGCLWLRNGENLMSKSGYSPYNPVTRGSTPTSWQQATFRRNGSPHPIMNVGFGDDWEVVSAICTDNNMNATGIGLGDARFANGSTSGGQRIAEMLIFGEVLSVETCEKIEHWLSRKWFGQSRPGINGNAMMGTILSYRTDWDPTGFPIDMDVPEGETVSLYKNQHGRGGCYNASVSSPTNLSSFVKKGAGTFALCDAMNFQGTVRLQEGRLTVPQRAVPAALPGSPYLHFDASQESTLVTETESGTEWVSIWRNLDPAKTFKDEAIVARAPAAQNRPSLLRDELGTGLHVLDFGSCVASMNGPYLAFATNETSAAVAAIEIPQCMTVVAVVGAQNGGGQLIGRTNDSYFRRGVNQPTSYRDKLFWHSAGDYAAYVNGAPMDLDANVGYENPGYQVVALRQSGSVYWLSTLQTLQASVGCSGGGRLAEVAVYLRALTHQELRDAQAFLMRKWLSRTAPGYCPPSTYTGAVLQNLRVEGEGELYVPEGETLVVGHVSGTKDLVKTGPGTVRIQEVDTSAGLRVVVKEGKALSAPLADVAGACERAPNPSLDLDASQVGHMETVAGSEGARTVRIWRDEGNYSGAFQFTGDNQPILKTEDGPNGHSWVDFGSLLHENGGRGMVLSRALNSVRAAYVVCRLAPQPSADYTSNYPMPLGSASEDGSGSGEPNGGVSNCDFLRQGGQFVSWNPAARCASNGKLFIDGVSREVTYVPSVETWQVLEYHTVGGSHVSALGIDRGTVNGGFALGEVLLYERPLSEREKVATRNYLIKKWLGKTDAELASLPDAPATSQLDVSSYVVADNARMDVATDQTVLRLSGSGTFEKTGAGTLSLADWSAFCGTVKISEGTLSLQKASPTSAHQVACVTDGLIYQADASQGIVATTNEEAAVQITEWRSALNDGWTAKPAKAGKYPTYIRADELNGGSVVDMAAGAQQAFVFYKDGVQTEIDTIRSAFWVFGSQNGGGFLMGGGYRPAFDRTAGTARLAWHRGGSAGFGAAHASDAILNSAHSEAVAYQADWRKNGVATTANTGLSGAWDLLSMNIKEDAANPVHAEGFAFDGRFLTNGGFADRLGSQRLAEVLLYNRRLTAAEIEQVEDYLSAKWSFGVQSAAATDLDVDLSETSTLDLGGALQIVGGLSGAGRVVNGTLQPIVLVADGGASACPSVEGTLMLTADTRVELRNLSRLGNLKDKEIKIADVQTLTGLQDMASTIFFGEELPPGVRASLKCHDGGLYVKFRGTGMTFIFR